MDARWIAEDSRQRVVTRHSSKVVGALLLTAFLCPACGSSDSEASSDGGAPDVERPRQEASADADHHAHDAAPKDAAMKDALDEPREAGTDAGPSLTVDDLLFATVGDTRPAIRDDGAEYPTAVIEKIFGDIAALSPAPAFVVGTGDYQNSTSTLEFAAPQLDIYMAARASYAGPFFPAMGNHECTGATTSNCGPGNADGVTVTYSAYLEKMLAPIGQPLPYYELHVAATDASWTAKFIFVAANVWNTEQETWLDAAMAEPTTYTFILRHEPAKSDTAPGVTPSEAVMAKYPYTLAIVGHVHTFVRSGTREVTVGNGGAPLGGSIGYGFGLVRRNADGTVTVEMIDYETGKSSQAFSLNADGTDAK
jgi:hypothetical protein